MSLAGVHKSEAGDDKSDARGGVFSAYKKLSLGVKILLWLVVGIIVGMVMRERAAIFEPLGDLFIRFLLMASIPLVFFNLIAGITSLTDVSVLGRLGARTLLYYIVTTAAALGLGLAIASLIKPGHGMSLEGAVPKDFGKVPAVSELLTGLVPSNVFEAMATGNVSQIVVFALMLGIATLMLPKQQKDSLQESFSLAAALLRQLVALVLAFAPVGVAALAAVTVGEHGPSVLGPLAKFIATVWSAQAIMVLFYMLMLMLVSRRNPFTWLRATAPLYATTAATCSSLASLVVSIDVADRILKIPQSIYSFTLPLGAQLNKDGTSIMLASVLLFTAQAAGVEFSLSSMVSILFVGLVLSEGSGGIPGGGLVIATIFVKAFNLPLEIAGIVAGIYRLIDMGSTTVNCMGDLVWTTMLADMEERRLNPIEAAQK
ncbi:MAG: dicarboxylate/amino acid:cation symporter [Planctomycetes bacterium]|nr:dicarboxylate/amino acid:cation symporter [Planctomycetota bacterium]